MAESTSMLVPSKRSIEDLPEEIILKILQYSNITCRNILNFGSLNHKFNEVIKDCTLWKKKLQIEWPKIYEVLLTSGNGDWNDQYRYIHILKNRIHKELRDMSEKFFWRADEITFADITTCFDLSPLEWRNISIFCMHSILADVYTNGDMIHVMDYPVLDSPYTLTNQYYAAYTIQHLMHLFLMVCWREMSMRNYEVLPEKVMNFFLNWIDTVHFQPYEHIKKMLDELAEEVKAELPPTHPLHFVPAETRDLWSMYRLNDNQLDVGSLLRVHSAIRHVLYGKQSMHVVPDATLQTLDLANVINKRKGHRIAVASIYEGIARRCGVRCQIISFGDHFFLVWRESNSLQSQGYYVDVFSGKLDKKGTCPFRAPNRPSSHLVYSPEALQRSLTDSLCKSYDNEKNNPYVMKAIKLMDVMSTDPEDVDIDYRRYLDFLEGPEFTHHLKDMSPPNFFNLQKQHFDLMFKLCMHRRSWSIREREKQTVYRNRKSSRVQLAVGMVCFHRLFHYECVITGWDAQCTAPAEWQQRMGVQRLVYKDNQPFYNVLVQDSSRRYVAQENLSLHVGQRLKNNENILGKEFSHFNGSYYISNIEKNAEYPDDHTIIAAYRRAPGLYSEAQHS